jgi:hypothetical protein
MSGNYKVKGQTILGLKKSSLALFMARVFADHTHHVLAFHDLARFTKSFH